MIVQPRIPEPTFLVRESSFNARSVLAFIVGVCVPIAIHVIGLIYLGELLLLMMAAWVTVTRFNQTRFWLPQCRLVIALLVVAMCSYVTTDLVRQTPYEDLARGWSRVAFTMTNFIGLYYLMRRNKAGILSFYIGYEIAAIAVFFTTDIHFNTIEARWKFELAVPLLIGTLSMLALHRQVAMRATPFLLVVFGALNVLYDYRSLGTICIIVSAILFSAQRRQQGRKRIDMRLLAAAGFMAAMIVASLYVSSQDKYGGRRSDSNSWRLGTTVATLKGIARSPIVGNGSWHTDDQMEEWRNAAMGVSHMGVLGSERFSGHSQLLQAWYEGGIFAEPFVLYYGVLLVLGARILIRRPIDNFSGLFLFLTLNAMWDIVFSPINGFGRINMAATMAVICYLLDERRLTQPAVQATAYRRMPQPVHAAFAR